MAKLPHKAHRRPDSGPCRIFLGQLPTSRKRFPHIPESRLSRCAASWTSLFLPRRTQTATTSFLAPYVISTPRNPSRFAWLHAASPPPHLMLRLDLFTHAPSCPFARGLATFHADQGDPLRRRLMRSLGIPYLPSRRANLPPTAVSADADAGRQDRWQDYSLEAVRDATL